MTRSFRLGRILGIPIELDYTWFIIFALITWLLARQILPTQFQGQSSTVYWVLGAVSAILFFTSVLLHELMHSYVAQRQGMEISGITLFVFGGVSKLGGEPRSAGQEFVMAIAGPATSFVLSVVFYGLAILGRNAGFWPPLVGVSVYLGQINLALGIFNMLPGFPLDGGRVLRAAIWQRTRNLAYATRIASGFGQSFGYLLIVLGVWGLLGGRLDGLWFIFIGWFLVQAAQSSYSQMILRTTLSGLPVSRLMTEQVVTVSPGLSLQQVVDDYFLTHSYAAFPVVEGGELRGIIHLRDVRAVPREEWATKRVAEAMESLAAAHTILPEADAWDAMVRMATEDQGRLIVVDASGALRGVISRSDLMQLIRTKLELGL